MVFYSFRFNAQNEVNAINKLSLPGNSQNVLLKPLAHIKIM